MRLMIIEKGSVNAAVFIAFQKRLIASAKRAIFRIVDRAPAHRAKKTAAFASTPGGNLRLFFPPPYSPDRNPDPLLGEHLEAAPHGPHRPGRLQPQGSIVHVPPTKRSRKNPLVRPETLPQIRRMNGQRLNGLINPVHQIACGQKFLYLLSERCQFATVHRFASFA
jgi:hypothetical protein